MQTRLMLCTLVLLTQDAKVIETNDKSKRWVTFLPVFVVMESFLSADIPRHEEARDMIDDPRFHHVS
jgi:hypothetical protein